MERREKGKDGRMMKEERKLEEGREERCGWVEVASTSGLGGNPKAYWSQSGPKAYWLWNTTYVIFSDLWVKTACL